MPPAPVCPPQAHLLARQRPLDKHRLAVDPGYTAPVMIERADLGRFRLLCRIQWAFQAASKVRQCASLRSPSQDRTRASSLA